jgi:transcription initiation factor TFIID TATA-box-binding protein
MRKRTYTPIDGRNSYVPVETPRVNETSAQTVPFVRNTRPTVTIANDDISDGIDNTRSGEHVVVTSHVSGSRPTCDTSMNSSDEARHILSSTPSTTPFGPTGNPVQSETAPIATIHNLVGTCEIQSSITPIDLERVYRSLGNSFYCRQRFAAITIRVTEPVCTGLLFTSGKLVITGCKTLIECVLASLKIVRMLQRHIPTVTFLVRNAVVQNVVAHVVIPLQPGQRLNVDRLYDTWCCNCTFQKNMFPGLIFRPDKSPVVLLLFYSVRSHPIPKINPLAIAFKSI